MPEHVQWARRVRHADGWRRIQGGAFEPLLMEGLRFHDQRIAKLEEENRGLRDSGATLRRELAELRERVLQIERALPGALATLPVGPEVN